MTYQELLDYYGSNSCAAAALEVSRQCVWKWKKQKTIPAHMQLLINRKTGGALKVDDKIQLYVGGRTIVPSESSRFSILNFSREDEQLAEAANNVLDKFVSELNQLCMAYNLEIVSTQRGLIVVLRKHDIFTDYAYTLKRKSPRIYQGKIEMGMLLNNDKKEIEQ